MNELTKLSNNNILANIMQSSQSSFEEVPLMQTLAKYFYQPLEGVERVDLINKISQTNENTVAYVTKAFQEILEILSVEKGAITDNLQNLMQALQTAQKMRPFDKSELPNMQKQIAPFREELIAKARQNKEKIDAENQAKEEKDRSPFDGSIYISANPARNGLSQKLSRPILVTPEGEIYVVAKKHKPLGVYTDEVDKRLGYGVDKIAWNAYHLDTGEEAAGLLPFLQPGKSSKMVNNQLIGEFPHLVKMRTTEKTMHLTEYQGAHLPKVLMVLDKYETTLDKKMPKLQTSSIKEKVSAMKDLAQSLVQQEEQQIIHNDLKPDNILYSKGHYKITDYSAARLESNKNIYLQFFVGNVMYKSPEAMKMDAQKPYARDMWSAGLIFAEIAWNFNFEKFIIEEKDIKSPAACTARTKNLQEGWHEIDFPRDAYTSGNIELDDLIRKMLATDPKKRITAQQLVERLEALEKTLA